jgi:hypothetical protein
MVARSNAPTKYAGGPVKDRVDIERLRRSMPDDPIKLPSGLLACEGCGVGFAGEAVDSLPLDDGGRLVAQYTRCPDCQRLHDHAAGERHVLNVLYALSAVGMSAPEDPGPLISWLRLVGSAVPWADPQAPSRDRCNPYPWAHVSLGQRAQIKEAYLLAMQSRVRVGAPPVALRPPWGRACLFCGVGSLPMAPMEVVRRGGRETATWAVWREVLVQPTALGGHGPDQVDGFLCPPCSEACDSVGAVGVRARARAFEQYVRAHRSEKEADRVRSMLDQYDQIVLPGWHALGTPLPNPEPWAHISVPEDGTL